MAVSDNFLQRMEPLCELLENVKNVSSRTAKIALLSSYDDEQFLKDILFYTYNPYYIYGIDKKSIDNDTRASRELPSLISLLDYLKVNNTGRYSDKLILWSFLNEIEDEFIRGYCKKVILKDLKIGVAIETINSIFPNLIPTFKVALCKPFKEESDLRFKEYIVQPKLDGVRVIAVCQGGDCKLFTRNGQSLEGYDEIVSELSKDVWQGFVLDGEIMSSNFDATMNDLFSKSKDKVAHYSIFDVLSMREFNEKKCHSNYFERWKMYLDMHADYLAGYLNSGDTKTYEELPIQVVEGDIFERSYILNNLKEMDEKARDFGYEGLVLKGTESMYSFKRDYSWVKFKKMLTDEFQIVDLKEGTGKYEGILGAITVIDTKTGVTTDVGSGFSDEQRENIFLNYEDYHGKLCEVKYQEKTKDGKLRFPTFVRMRTDL